MKDEIEFRGDEYVVAVIDPATGRKMATIAFVLTGEGLSFPDGLTIVVEPAAGVSVEIVKVESGSDEEE